MDFKYFVSQVAHPFILYVLFGTFVSYFGLKLFFAKVGVNNARTRLYLLFIPLFLPLFAFVLIQNVYNKQCITGINYTHQTFNIINHWLCTLGDFLAFYVTPLFIITGTVAVIKAFVSLVACKRMVARYGFAGADDYPEIYQTLSQLCRKAGLTVPRVLITRDNYAKSFTFGYRRPVIVLSEGLLEFLDEEELEAVLAHELAHIIRADSILNWVTVFLRDIMFFTPVMFWLFKDISREREHAADDIAIMLSDKPLALAGALVKVWRLSPKGFFKSLAYDNFMPYPQFAAGEGALESRLKRLMDDEVNEEGLGKTVILGGLIISLSLFILYFVC